MDSGSSKRDNEHVSHAGGRFAKKQRNQTESSSMVLRRLASQKYLVSTEALVNAISATTEQEDCDIFFD